MSMLSAHLEWRSANLPLRDGALTLGGGLPDMASMLDSRTRDGSRIMLVHGAMYDPSLGSHDAYALALAAFLDANLQRESDEKATVVVDVRGGDGWTNPRPWSALPWLRVLASTLSANYPERLKRLVLFPVPWVARTAWTAVSAFLEEATANKVTLLSGPASRTDPIPAEIDEFLDAACVAECEAKRESRLGSNGAARSVKPTGNNEAAVAAASEWETVPAAPASAPAKEAPAAPAPAPPAADATSFGLAELELA